MSEIYEFERGETIVLALDIQAGDPLGATIAAAHMRRTSGNAGRPLRETEIAAQFTVTPRAEAGDIAAGWDLVIDASASRNLQAGRYWADAILTQGGRSYVLSGIVVAIVEPATVLP